jgi:hypothetical protein
MDTRMDVFLSVRATHSNQIKSFLPGESDTTLQKNNDNKGEQIRIIPSDESTHKGIYFRPRNYCISNMKNFQFDPSPLCGTKIIKKTALHKLLRHSLSPTVFNSYSSQFITSAVIFEEKL